MAATKTERDEAVARLHEFVKPGDEVYTVMRHVSRSGMSRSISLVVMDEGAPFDVSWLAARAMGDRIDQERGGIKIGGAGMDMGFALVYNLGRTLWPEAFDCIGDGCPANDHSNGDRDYTPHRHSDGGYALRHRWL